MKPTRAALNRISLGKVAAETKVAAGTARKVGFEGEIVRSQMQAARNREWRSKQVDTCSSVWVLLLSGLLMT